jgi:DNA-binding NtrC family response regulator
VGREGFVAEAENGTLFLDEVGELSLRAQAKLLRFLENGEYHRLGETRMRRAHVRVVSATNVDLPCHVSRGLFREDLLYRLVVHTIALPPLRDRGRDILLLLEHFLRRELGPERRPPRLSQEAERVLLRFPWPGNVRQLVNEARRLVVSAEAGTVRPSDLSADVREFEGGPGGRLQAAKDEFERRFIRRALERNGGNRTATAAELGISRQALVAKIGRLGIARGRADTPSATVATRLRSVGSRGPLQLGY